MSAAWLLFHHGAQQGVHADGHRHRVLRTSGRDGRRCPYERFYESFTEAFRYIEEQGYKVVGQHRTCYIDGAWNQEDPGKWLSVIQIPIE